MNDFANRMRADIEEKLSADVSLIAASSGCSMVSVVVILLSTDKCCFNLKDKIA